MLTICYMVYQYNDFLIYRFLAQQDPTANSALLNVSATILSAILLVGLQREHMSSIHRDFTWAVRQPLEFE